MEFLCNNGWRRQDISICIKFPPYMHWVRPHIHLITITFYILGYSNFYPKRPLWPTTLIIMISTKISRIMPDTIAEAWVTCTGTAVILCWSLLSNPVFTYARISVGIVKTINGKAKLNQANLDVENIDKTLRAYFQKWISYESSGSIAVHDPLRTRFV